MKNTNAATAHPILTCTVVSKGNGWLEYRLFHGKGTRKDLFRGTLSVDYRTIETMEVGQSYAVSQSVDVTNTTHWTEAKPITLHTNKQVKDTMTVQQPARKLNLEQLEAELFGA